MPVGTFAILLSAAYLLGAVPFGLLIGKARGVDVRRSGSGNIGATNVGRVLGRKWGYLCLTLDVLKGFAPTFAASYLLAAGGAAALGPTGAAPVAAALTTAALTTGGADAAQPTAAGADAAQPTAAMLGQWLAIALAAVLGHVFPVYLRFRGGKGVATTVGAGLGIFPYATLPMAVAVGVYGVIRLTTGLVSLGSLAIAVVFPLSFFAYARLAGLPMDRFWPLQAATMLMGVLIILRHRGNIGRLLAGKEMQMQPQMNADERR